MSENEYIRQKTEKKFPLSRYSKQIQRMCRASYEHRYYGNGDGPIDYAERFSFTDDDIPALLEIATWLDRTDMEMGDYWNSPFHAWEALSQLDPGRVVPGMLEILNYIDWDEADHALDILDVTIRDVACRSITEAKETGDTSRNMIPLILDALREKERHSTTRTVLLDALCMITAPINFPEYCPEFHQILLDELKELRIDCRDWYAACVCELAFQENPTTETVALLEKVCREGYADPGRYWTNDGMVNIAGFDYDNDPQLIAIHKKSIVTREILYKFRSCGNTFPRQAILDARELRDWIIPNLIEIVRDATAYARFGVPSSSGGTVLFAVHLLAEFQAKEALPAIFDSLALSSDQAWDYLYEDATYESMPGILNRLIGDDPEFYDRKLRDPQTSTLLRCLLLTAQQYLVQREILSEEAYGEGLRDYLEIAIREENHELVSSLVCDISNIVNPEYIPLVRSAFEQELVDEFMIPLEYAEECLNGRNRYGSMPLAQMLVDPKRDFSDAMKEMSRWVGFQEEIKRPAPSFDNEINLSQKPSGNILHLSSKPSPVKKSFETPSEPIRAPQKIGRNDPCPCGSGRKYKKCCMES